MNLRRDSLNVLNVDIDGDHINIFLRITINKSTLLFLFYNEIRISRTKIVKRQC